MTTSNQRSSKKEKENVQPQQPDLFDIVYIEQRTFLQRTFGQLTPGGVRGNIFLLIMTTIGASFFLIPYAAKRSGLGTAIIFLILSGLCSYGCCLILYKGYDYTKAKTYNECMEKILGQKFGFFSSCVVLLHVFGSAVTSLIFSFKFLSQGLYELFEMKPTAAQENFHVYLFFIIAGFIIFIVTMFKSIEKLKIVSLVGIGFLGYLVVCFILKTPQYYNYYKSKGQLEVTWFINDKYVFKAWGIISYMFLNQYTIMPLCHGTVRISFIRIQKIFARALFTVFWFYCLILGSGYFSQPNEMKEQILLLRPKIEGTNDQLIVIGKVCFGLALFVGVLIRSYFLLVYMDNWIQKYREVFLGESVQFTQPLLEDKKINEPQTILEKLSSNLAWSKGVIIRNFFYMTFHITISILFKDYLGKIIGFIGGFVGVCEIIIIPAIMFLALDEKQHFLSTVTKLGFLGIVFALLPLYISGAIFSLILE